MNDKSGSSVVVKPDAGLTETKTDFSRRQFVAMISHEMRTPINGILGMAHLLDTTKLDSEQKDCVDTIKFSAESLLGIVNDILDYSKIEAGKLEFETLPFDFIELIEQTMDMLSVNAFGKGLEFYADIDETVPRWLVGDAIRLRQVIVNLVGNAVKFTRSGSVVLRVINNMEAGNQVCLRFEIQDSGIGIPPGKLEHIFHSFSQADSSTTRRFGGTGLGLAICKRIIGGLGGDIGVESVEGEGSVFWFTIDLMKKEVSNQPKDELYGGRVMLVCNPGGERDVIHRYLSGHAADVALADDLTQAERVLSDSRTEYGVVICDCSVGHVECLKLSTGIGGWVRGRKPKLLYLRKHGSPDDLVEWRAAGFDEVVSKPLKSGVLRQVVKRALANPACMAGNNSSADGGECDFGLRVLVAEDNEINAKVTANILSMLGCEVDLAVNGIEAVEKNAANQYDLIFMDISMPEMDGLEAARRICGSSVDHPPIIAMSAACAKDAVRKCAEAGMNDYIAKPITPKSLYDLLVSWGFEGMLGEFTVDMADLKNDKDAPIDITQALGCALGDYAILKTLMDDFIASFPERFEAIKTAAEAPDTAKLRFLAHSIKGVARQLGASIVADKALNIEKMAIAGELQDFDTAFTGLSDACARLNAYIEDNIG